MPPMPFAASGFDVDDATHTIRFVRRLAAAPQAVFDAWTQPEQVSRWWDPTGAPLVRCEIDLHVGGTFTFLGEGHPQMPFSGTYREICPPGRLLFDAMGAEGRVLLDPEGEGAAMTVEIACATDEHLRQFVAMGVADGTSRTLDNLVALFA
jgi:uncharacterized protein YndB with AHSA1/START domain